MLCHHFHGQRPEASFGPISRNSIANLSACCKANAGAVSAARWFNLI
tara:strand:- start:1749 stop:1889 length:141 start_codon:yes stop_codon:yes gene_type:complete